MIDSNIALSGHAVQFDTTGLVNLIQQGRQRQMQQESHAQQMQIGAQTIQENAQQIKERQRQSSEGDQLRELFRQSPDLRTALPGVFKINPTVGIAMQKSLHEQEKAALDLEKTGIETQAEKAKRFGSIAGTITDEPTLHQGIVTALNEKLIDPAAAQQILTTGWTPQTQAQVQQIAQGGMTVDQQKTAALKANEEKRQALAAQHEAELHPLKVDEAQAKASAANRENDAAVLAAAARQGPDALAYQLRKLSETSPDRIEPFMRINGQTKPEEILRLGMKPHEIASADTAAKNAENNVTEYELELRAAKGDQAAKTALANRQRDKVAQAAAGGAATRGLDREIGQYGKPFDEMTKGADSQLDKILDAEKMVAGGAVSQALAIPKILAALVSGQGSGVRITQAELNSIIKARGISGDVEGFFNKLTGQGTLTAGQKQQMNAILGDVQERIVQKKMIARQVTDEMQGATTREGVLGAAKKGRDALDAHAAQQGAPEAGGSMRVKRKSDGVSGTIDAKDFDPAKYDKVQP